MINPNKDIQRFNRFWQGYIDFSKFEINGYIFKKCTFDDAKNVSAFISQNNIDIINSLSSLFVDLCKTIPIYKKKIYHLKKDITGLENSFLFKIYCNGFTIGFKEIEKIVNAHHVHSSELDSIVMDCIYSLDYLNKCPNEKTQKISSFIHYLLDLGRKEGMEFYIKIYNQRHLEKNKTIKIKKDSYRLKEGSQSKQKKVDGNNIMLSDLLIKNQTQIIEFVENSLIKHNSTECLANLFLALKDSNLLNSDHITLFRSAIFNQYKHKKIKIVGERAIQNKVSSIDNESLHMDIDPTSGRKYKNIRRERDSGDTFIKIQKIKDELAKYI